MNTVCLPLFLNDHNIFGVGIPVALQYILTGDFFRALTVLSIGETILSGSEKDIKRLHCIKSIALNMGSHSFGREISH